MNSASDYAVKIENLPMKNYSEEELIEFTAEKLSKIELPAQIEFRAELPKTMIGKLSKKELKAEEAGRG